MATNKSMIELLERGVKLIEELNAIKDVLKFHIAAQKTQPSKDFNDKYVYDEVNKKYVREFN